MPNLEHLKKQAKQYLRWRREGYFPVAAQIRAHVPRFAGMTDREIFAAEFKLSDAQDLVARKAGFDGRGALIKGVAEMTLSSAPEGNATILSS